MLCDPRWKVETKTDLFSVASLIAWLEKQSPYVAYNWECSEGGCLIGMYCKANGLDFFACHTAFFKRDELWIACDEPRTFGAALERARKAELDAHLTHPSLL